MSWALKGLAGPLNGKTFPMKSGLTLGRQGQVVVPDLKASSIHARITQGAGGLWLLEDNSSKNGTRIGGERITSAKLTNGSVFFIGEQGFEVIETKGETTSAAPPLPDVMSAPPEPPPPPPKERRYWHELLAEFLEKNKGLFSERKRPVSALNPALILEFVRGVQVSSRWVLGYGPRKVGPNSLDLPLWEPGAPAVCFEILPSTDGIVFKTAHPDLVHVNGVGVDSHVLRVGDTIQINETLIEVDFTE